MKVKLFTHSDFDGIGCAILGKMAFTEIDIEYCDYNNVNNKIKTFVENKEYEKYDYIFITDISVNEEIAELIENTHPTNFREGFNLPEMVQLIDHHPTAKNLEKYWWCDIRIEDEKGKCSGTSLFYEYLEDDKYPVSIDNTKYINTFRARTFVETVRRYDSWEWTTKYNDLSARDWNSLVYLYGRDRFIERVLEILTDDSYELFEFNKTDELLLEIEKDKKNNYFEKKSKELITVKIQDYNVGVVFAEQYISELGNYLATQNTDVDFIALISAKTVSYRGVKDDIDLGLFAKQFGGGGHPKASGSEISKDKQLEYIKSMFS